MCIRDRCDVGSVIANSLKVIDCVQIKGGLARLGGVHLTFGELDQILSKTALIFVDQVFLTPVSYTHLDVYKRQVQASYDDGKTDEFVLPTVIEKDGKPVAVVSDKDSVVFFNFRPDRAREITRAFCDAEFTGFAREKRLDLTYVCFTDYDDTIGNKLVAFHKVQLHNTFGEYLAAHNMTQARIAETEKYAHVTFFFNGGVEEPNKGEDRILSLIHI